MNAETLEKFCLSLKGTTTDVKWGNDLCYLVGGKMYCVTPVEGPFSVSLKTNAEEFSELIEREGVLPAPYTGRYHWVLVERSAALSIAEWKKCIRTSYELVRDKLPSKLKKSLS